MHIKFIKYGLTIIPEGSPTYKEKREYHSSIDIEYDPKKSDEANRAEELKTKISEIVEPLLKKFWLSLEVRWESPDIHKRETILKSTICRFTLREVSSYNEINDIFINFLKNLNDANTTIDILENKRIYYPQGLCFVRKK